MWKVILPVIILILIAAAILISGVGKKAGFPSVTNLPQQSNSTSSSGISDQPITSKNADQILSQTDTAINSDMTQLDRDLQALDQTSQSQDNTDSSSVSNLWKL